MAATNHTAHAQTVATLDVTETAGSALAPNEAPSDQEAVVSVTVQVSSRLHPQLFHSIQNVKKRDRAERLRWLSFSGLIAEQNSGMRSSQIERMHSNVSSESLAGRISGYHRDLPELPATEDPVVSDELTAHRDVAGLFM